MNIKKMMQQAQKMQKDIERVQKELKEKTVESSIGSSTVKITANGQKELLSISIHEEVVDPKEIEVLEDLLMVALNDVLQKAEDLSSKELGKVSKGLNFPGLF